MTTTARQPAILDRRRRGERMTAGFPARVWDEIGWQQVWCDDVSRDGLRLTGFRSRLGERMRVTLQLPGGGELDVDARVVRVTRNGKYPDPSIGVSLVDPDPSVLSVLDYWIRQRAAQSRAVQPDIAQPCAA